MNDIGLKMPPPPNKYAVDEALARGNGDEYIPAWLKKHCPEKIETGDFTCDSFSQKIDEECVLRYPNLSRRLKKYNTKRAVRCE